MIGSCPECGFSGSLSAFLSEGAFKEALSLALKLPKEVQAELVPYLGLFRPERRSLTGARTLRVVRELLELVQAGRVDWEKLPPRPAGPKLWAEGMRGMVERKAAQRAHMTSHNYLRRVVYDLADKVDAAREGQVRQAERNHERPPAVDPSDRPDPSDPSDEPVSLEEAAENRREFFEAMKGLGGKLSMPGPKKAARPEQKKTRQVACGECAACQAGVPSRCANPTVAYA